MNIFEIHANDLATHIKTDEKILNLKKSSIEDDYSLIGIHMAYELLLY